MRAASATSSYFPFVTNAPLAIEWSVGSILGPYVIEESPEATMASRGDAHRALEIIVPRCDKNLPNWPSAPTRLVPLFARHSPAKCQRSCGGQ
jgi:hypothetical protein